MESTGQGLDYILDEGGSNLSVGEKQLLCLGKSHPCPFWCVGGTKIGQIRGDSVKAEQS